MSSAPELHVKFGEFELDESNAQLLRGGRAIALAPIPFGLLCALLRKPGSLFTKHALLDQVWGHRFVSDSVLKGAISDIRKALGDDPRQPSYIETVPRRGYRFIAATMQQSGEADLAVDAEPGPMFIGRTSELTRLQRAWERAARGNRGIVWIAGEPGIGKTTLIEYFLSTLGSAMCVRGQCVQQHGTGEPYLPVLEALAELCRRDSEAAVLLRSVAPTWILQMPWLSTAEQRDALLRELVGSNPQRMLREIGEFIDRYSERQPLLLITEDLQWADYSTIQLIDYVARRRGSSRFMWIASFRLTEIIALDHPLNALRHELRLQGLCEEIVLDSFSETEVAAYLAERTPATVTDEQFVRDLHERTSGVPLFVAAIVSEVIDSAAHSSSAELISLVTSTVPESLSALIDHYITRLTGDRRTLLAAASVCGVRFRMDTLAHVLGNDTALTEEACDALARERLWLVSTRQAEHGDGTDRLYAFRHALFRQRLYDSMAVSARTELHHKVGLALEEERAAGLDVAAAELATHFDLGRAPMTALRYYAEAAQAALLHLSPTESMNLTKRALSIAKRIPESAERRSFEITLATLQGTAAFHTLGAGVEARSAYLRATTLLDDAPLHPMAGLALHGFGFLLDLRAEYPAALAAAKRAEALGAQGNDPILIFAAWTVEGQVMVMQGHPMLARELLERALPTVEQVSATAEQSFIGFIADPQVTVLGLLSLALAQLGRFPEARARLQEAYRRARFLAQPMSLMVTMWFEGLCAIRGGDVDRVGALAKEMQSLVDEFTLTQGAAAHSWFRGWALAHAGNPLEGFRLIRKAYEDNRALGMISGSTEMLGCAAEVLVLHGDFEGAKNQLQQALDIVESHGERIFLPQLLLVQSAIERSQGDKTAAQDSIRRAIDEARGQGASWLVQRALTEYSDQVPVSTTHPP